MKKKKKEIIGMGNPTRNMELFNQALGTGNVTGTLVENLTYFQNRIAKSKLCKLLTDLGFEDHLYGIEIADNILNLDIEMVGVLRYNFLTKDWSHTGPFGGDPVAEGKGFNNLIDELIFQLGPVNGKNYYYLKTYFAKSDTDEFETDSQDELIDWCKNIFETDMGDKIQVINTDNFKEVSLNKDEF